MAENEDGLQPKPAVGISQTKNTLAGIVAALFVIALGYSAYNYFASTGVLNKQTPGLKNEENISSTSTVREASEEGAKLNVNLLQNDSEKTETVINAEWKANDYKSGDIDKGSYTVKSGDTLWEVAEAVYGDGSQWVKILDANSDQVEFLADGSQALIVPGQQLLIL